MEILLGRLSGIIRRLRLKQRIFRIEEIKQLFDDIVSYLNQIPAEKRKSEGMHLLGVLCEELASVNQFRLFDYGILRAHRIFLYISRTFEMLLTKCTYSQSISMTNNEDDCLDSMSYFIAQLCIYQNEPVELFYGKISSEIFPVTEKPNQPEKVIRRVETLMEKPNLKTARLPSTAPVARLIEQTASDITHIVRLRKFPSSYTPVTTERPTESIQVSLRTQKFDDLFLTKVFFEQMIRLLEDLSRNDYSSYHIKYKLLDRLIRLCSKMNIDHIRLVNPIIKCLRSKHYNDVHQAIDLNQVRLSPKELFFLHECPQFLIEHAFVQQDKLAEVLSKTLIQTNKVIFEKFFSSSMDIESGQLFLHALSCHLEFLYHLSLTPSARQQFAQSSVINQFELLLKQSDLLISNASVNEHLFDVNVGIIAYTLMFLYNMAYDQTIFSLLKVADWTDILSSLQTAKNGSIQFASKTLASILNEEKIDQKNEPRKLKEEYIKYLQSLIIEPKRDRRLGRLRNLEDLATNTKYRFITESFLDKLTRDIQHLSTYEHLPNVSQYKEVVRRVRVCSKQETNEVESLLDPIIACLTSEYYLKAYDTMDLEQIKDSSRVKRTPQSLAPKQLFFMRECPEFVMRHDYKRQNEIRPQLCEQMLGNADQIFQAHLVVLIEHVNTETKKIVRIEALTWYIKFLNHFALISSTREQFLKNKPIIEKIFLILEHGTAHVLSTDEGIDVPEVGIVGQCLILLYNLAFDKQILSILKEKNLLQICDRLRPVKDRTIQLASQTLLLLLNPQIYESISEPNLLTKTCVKYIEKSVKETRQPFEGVRLNHLLKSLETIVLNGSVQECLIEEKEGIPALTKCVCVECLDNPSLSSLKHIRQSSLKIIRELLFIGPTVTNKFKASDEFVEHLLILSCSSSSHIKKYARDLIWRLGNEEDIRLEQAEKQKQGQDTTEVEDQLPSNEEWDDSVPFDLIMSFSNDLNIKSLCNRIRSRLMTSNIKVYSKEQSIQRLELIKKAVDKKKILLVCLSTKYRKSKVCMAELEYAFNNKCPMIPVIVEANYKPKGWLNHLLGGKKTIDFTEKNFKETILDLVVEIERIK